MKKLLLIILALIFSAALLQGCGGGDGRSSALVDSVSIDMSDIGGGSGIDKVGLLGGLVDLGDLVQPRGDHWYFTRTRAINDQGIVIGESNQGSVTKAGFKWDPAGQTLTFLGIHAGIYDDFYNQQVLHPPQFFHGFAFSEAVGINTSGTIIGNSLTGLNSANGLLGEEKRAFLWKNDVFLDLPPIPGVLTSEGFFDKKISINSYSEAVDINAKGEMVLTLDDNTEAGRHAYYWDGISTTNAVLPRDDNLLGVIGTFIPVVVPVYEPLGTIVGATSEAVAINENGQALMASGGTVLFVDRNWGILESLNHLPGAKITVAVDLNDSIYTNNDNIPDGHVIGNSGDFDRAEMGDFLNNSFLTADEGILLTDLGRVQGFFWDGGAMYPVNHFGGGKSVTADLNNKDQVVGGALTAEGTTHAFLWTLGVDKKGHIVDLGTLGGANSMALAINEAGQIAGWSETGDFYQEQGVTLPIRHGFLWDKGTMYDLGTHDHFYDYPFKPPYPFSEVVDINESGDIAGNSITINDHSRGFYLKPIIPASVIPIP